MSELAFGTAGVRAVMGPGGDRMNVDTVKRISQGFADKLKGDAGPAGGLSIAIAYDNRRDSDLFAFESACVFAANGIAAHLFKELSATPLLSFAVRRLGCTAGVVITASHNNRDYNGYKIYDGTGCQCLTEDASKVAARIAETKAQDVKTASGDYKGGLSERMAAADAADPLFNLIPDAVEDEFIDAVAKCSLTPGACDGLRLVYTPLNGTGNRPVTEILRRIGVKDMTIVAEQEKPDSDFTTCPEPNPEKEAALKLGLDLCAKMEAEGRPVDVLLATDPDCDRVGVALRTDGSFMRLNGNQIGILLFDYIIESKKKSGAMPGNPLAVTTIVSTPLIDVIAKANGAEVKRVLTGFKYIGEIMNGLEASGKESRFLLGFEESCGYLTGVHVRDKDGVNAAMLIAEMAGLYKSQGKTLADRLTEIYEEYGYFLESLEELVRPGESGMKEIAGVMNKFRDPAIMSSFVTEVSSFKDYARGIEGLPGAEVLSFTFAGGSSAILRPSGTEPKLKIYFASAGKTRSDAEAAMKRMKEEVMALI